MEFQPGRNTTSVVVAIVDDVVYGFDLSSMDLRLFSETHDFVTIGRKRRLVVQIVDDEVYTVKIASFPDFVTEGNDAAAVVVLDIQEPPGGSSVTPHINTVVRVTGGSARGKLEYTSHSNANVLSPFPKFTPFQLTVTIDHQMS